MDGITNEVIEIEDDGGDDKNDDSNAAVELEHCITRVHFTHIEKSKIKYRLDFDQTNLFLVAYFKKSLFFISFNIVELLTSYS